MVGVDGVEPPVFTQWERIYSPLQNTPYLQHTRNWRRRVVTIHHVPAYETSLNTCSCAKDSLGHHSLLVTANASVKTRES